MKRHLRQFTVHQQSTMEDAIALIQTNDSRCVVVVRDDEKVVGVFSEGDVLRALLGGADIRTPLSKLTKPSFRYLKTRDLAAARKLLLSGFPLIPIIDDDFYLHDVVVLADAFKDEVT
jgi:CBS domain-containing protein